MATVFHIAFARDWAAAQAAGAYTMSTRGRTLAEEGFVHCSRGDQWPAVRDAFYADVDVAVDPLVLLQIDTARLDVPVVEEAPAPGVAETFPHVYGPIPVGAVVRALPLDDAPDPGAPTDSFARAYFREVFVNVALVSVVLLLGCVGLVLGALVHDEAGPGVGGLLGVALGVGVAAGLYRRRHAGAA